MMHASGSSGHGFAGQWVDGEMPDNRKFDHMTRFVSFAQDLQDGFNILSESTFSDQGRRHLIPRPFCDTRRLALDLDMAGQDLARLLHAVV